ncbi:MAG: type III pantothenate kinase [Gammaproteobacteria bacterium]|nr:type III pantothenate kinase [Gammaproteobacteria bacterium]MDH3410835.1 type III pantothenate kinase [Gammaproteobacteria bacterium]
MTALLMDVGNSRLKWGVLEDSAIRRTGHIAQQKIRERGLTALTSKLPRHVDTVFASNVAGTSFATRLSGVIGMHCNADVHFAKSEKEACGVTNSYRQARRLGVDRWVAMIGAWAEVNAACLVVDAGTAVTLDALDDDGRHLGGQILPGVLLMTETLASRTSDIPSIKRRAATQGRGMEMFASSTAGAIGHGAMNAVVGAIERAVDVMLEDGLDATIVLTGGDASRILKSLGDEPLHRPHLVLQGLAKLLESRQ